ncbi:MAG: tyrosine-type recombinase/integrase [Propionibacteriaceae bacterium]
MAPHVAGRTPDDVVFTGPRGGALRSQGFQRLIPTEAAESVGLEGLHPHALRHTAASLAIASGANVKVVQQMLGHKSATMTLDLYGHLFPDQLDQVAEHHDADARAAVYPLCTRGDIAPETGVPEDAENPLLSRGSSGVAPTGFEPALTP